MEVLAALRVGIVVTLADPPAAPTARPVVDLAVAESGVWSETPALIGAAGWLLTHGGLLMASSPPAATEPERLVAAAVAALARHEELVIGPTRAAGRRTSPVEPVAADERRPRPP